MFEASHRSDLLDWFRVPYTVADEPARISELADCASLRPRRDGASALLFWPTAASDALGPPEQYVLEGSTFFARLVPDEAVTARLAHGDWQPWLPIRSTEGGNAGSIWRAGDGSVFLPFSPDEALLNYWSEAYEETLQSTGRRRAKQLALRAYYALRPLMPRGLQIALRRRLARVQRRRSFPAWPAEPSLHDLCDLVLGLAAGVAGEPVPVLAPWPEPYDWALVLTHDVELQVGFDNIARMADIERAAGYRSAWNLVPRRYEIDDARVRQLADDGFEIGVHGLYHDGRDLESETKLRERLPAMREAAERWGATGFRSPATHRIWELMPLLEFDHDSSYPDTDPFEPKAGGCCSWLPYFNESLVELPITLVQDHTLFVILGHDDESAWAAKAELLRDRGGMALLITHPDYMLDAQRLGAYERLLARFADDPTMWRALPRDVSLWWRRRAASRIVTGSGGVTVEGPAAAEARVAFVRPRDGAGPHAAYR